MTYRVFAIQTIEVIVNGKIKRIKCIDKAIHVECGVESGILNAETTEQRRNASCHNTG